MGSPITAGLGRGPGAGEGCNLNLPLPPGSGFGPWRAALGTALDSITRFGAGARVVALGVDTYEGDPISRFTLASGDARRRRWA